VIRARATSKDGKPVILLGVTRENIRRLVDMKQPIRVTGESVNTPEVESIGIWFAETESELLAQLRSADVVDADTTMHVEQEVDAPRIIVPGAATRSPIMVGWDSRTEKVAAKVDHGLLVVPHGEGEHRAYFVADDQELGEMLAVVLALASRRRNGAALAIAQRVLQEGKAGDFRGSK
jgi:hypothetical protein